MNDIQLQVYIVMAVGALAIIILIILDIVLFSIIERLKEEVRHKIDEKSKTPVQLSYSNPNVNSSPVRRSAPTSPVRKNFNSAQIEEIQFSEEMNRRGFKRYPSFSPSLVTRVDSR